jgi:hypothetical protein
MRTHITILSIWKLTLLNFLLCSIFIHQRAEVTSFSRRSHCGTRAAGPAPHSLRGPVALSPAGQAPFHNALFPILLRWSNPYIGILNLKDSLRFSESGYFINAHKGLCIYPGEAANGGADEDAAGDEVA